MRKTYAALKSLFKGDGCTSAPELWFHDACNIHDCDYKYHHDENGVPLSRLQADRRFLRNMINDSPNRFIRCTIPYIYYYSVRAFGQKYWSRNDE